MDKELLKRHIAIIRYCDLIGIPIPSIFLALLGTGSFYLSRDFHSVLYGTQTLDLQSLLYMIGLDFLWVATSFLFAFRVVTHARIVTFLDNPYAMKNAKKADLFIAVVVWMLAVALILY